MKSLHDIFGQADGVLEEVVILSVGLNGAGSYSLPSGYSWTDFEYITILSGNASGQSRGSNVVTKQFIQANPTAWASILSVGDADTSLSVTVSATSLTGFTIAAAGTVYINSIVGYKKRYATRNTSKTLMVNGGSNVAVSSRYEIDITSELGPDYLNRDLVVVAEIYNSDSNAGSAITGWGDPGWVYTSAGAIYGVKASVSNGKIIVQTGRDYLASINGNVSGHPFGVLSAVISSTLCRVKVWKVDEYLPATKSSGDMTAIWEGSAGVSVTVDWSGTGYNLSDFDVILIEGLGYRVTTTTPFTLDARIGKLFSVSNLFANQSLYHKVDEVSAIGTDTSRSTLYITGITETSIFVGVANSGGYNEPTVTGIYGINFN